MADFTKAIPIIKRSEGGLSKNTSDSASKDPVPDGSGYHTNKGITWTAFKAFAKKLNYDPSPKLFYEMPEAIWRGITKVGYWDTLQADKIRSQSVATILVDWNFGSGNWSVKNLQTILNTKFNYKLVVDGFIGSMTLMAINAVNQKDLTNYLYQARIEFINKISKGNNAKFKNGWIDDAKYTYDAAIKYLPTGIAGVLALAASVFF